MSAFAAPRVFAPVLTPFRADLSIDAPRFVAFCRWLVGQGAGLAPFGTNSEANSLSVAERCTLLDEIAAADIDPAQVLPGTGACALPDAIALTRHAVATGCAGVLMLPPFFYQGVSDEGLFAYYAGVIDAVGSERLRVLLYHIPQLTGVPITHTLIERLVAAYPRTVVGIKDSSGDWANTVTMLERFPGFAVFPASEALLGRALPLGAAGCISATANLQPHAIAQLLAAPTAVARATWEGRVSTVRTALQSPSMIPALKAVVAHFTRHGDWARVRAPLASHAAADTRALLAQLDALGFTMPSIDEARA
ncbi:dihydrodipicolinate synthase family protein [Burkholderia arboris]|uniref:Dihydrodipicolinate synthase family protein n=1 Tax=Burkholderia arboris TaxID=488730 RepID=A0A9Q9SM17_9BURK|nr:dihydrodipicolinate synthase family protein [Burkholderia arboris]UTV60409.1 dihydrodipicolinate synthase family protein [Burkholderia arboris]VWC02813.1 dihydrodipicolinate synthetase [Burkholderia arboris]